MITFRRTGGLRLPQFDESLEIADDGGFTMWRSVSKAAALPSPIGRFRGQLPAEQARAIGSAAEAAAAEGARTWPILPDSPVDRIVVGAAEARLGMREPAEGAWADLVASLRPLLKELTAHPAAAIALEVDGGAGARLVHLGPDELRIDLSELSIEAVHWWSDEAVGSWDTNAPGGSELTVGPGWSLALPFGHGFELHEGDRVAVQVAFAAYDGDRWIPVALQTP